MKYFVGVDIGKTGGIVVLDNNEEVVLKCVMPDIGGEFDLAIGEIKFASFCYACNPQIAQDIKVYLEVKHAETFFTFEKIIAKIRHQTLTYQQAEEDFTQLETILNKIKDDLRNLISQLPEQVQNKITNILNNRTDAMRQKKENILVLLTLKRSANTTNKWNKILNLGVDIRTNVLSTIAKVVMFASEANYEIGKQIATYLKGKTPEFIDILEKFIGEIQAQTLTYQKAEKYFKQLQSLLNKVKDDLRNFVSQLPQNTQVDIKNVLDKNIESIREKKNEIFNLLSLKRLANTSDKWKKIDELLWGIRAYNTVTFAQIVTVAEEANQEVGEKINVYLEGKFAEANVILGKLIDETDAETLTHSQADTYFTQLETLLNKVKDDLTNFVSELPVVTQVRIKAILKEHTKITKEHAGEILTLLTLKY